MSQNKWKLFKGKKYRLENLGRPAIFLLPIKKLHVKLNALTIEEDLRSFLIKNFGAYSVSIIPSFGLWKNSEGAIISDECRQYEVSFVGKEKIPLLLGKLAEIVIALEEECIYFKAGQYSCLVYPIKGDD